MLVDGCVQDMGPVINIISFTAINYSTPFPSHIFTLSNIVKPWREGDSGFISRLHFSELRMNAL
jgi:hypothetical protein